VIAERTTAAVRGLAEDDPEIAVWWATPVECISAISRRERASAIDPETAREAIERLAVLAEGWHGIDPVEAVRQSAIRLLRVHALSAADALQLAAAVVTSEGVPSTLEVVTLDDALADASEREGFRVIRPQG
jgi:predicted nucleic acid-binding protein